MHAKCDDGNTIFGSTQLKHVPRLGVRKGFPTGIDILAESWRMCRSEPNKQKEEECSRQRDSLSESSKDKWERSTCRNSKELPAAGEEPGGGSTWTQGVEGQKETGGEGLVREGFGSHRKQLFTCSDQVRLPNLFLNLHLRTMTLKVKQLFSNQRTLR